MGGCGYRRRSSGHHSSRIRPTIVVDYPHGYGFPANVDDIQVDPNVPISETLYNTLLRTFHQIFTPDIINKFITATNVHGAFRSPVTWKEIDVKEFHAFLGCIIYLGIFK